MAKGQRSVFWGDRKVQNEARTRHAKDLLPTEDLPLIGEKKCLAAARKKRRQKKKQ
jgi:hypothetical protein